MSQATVPGTVIHHVPAATRNYVGCPSIVVLRTGKYIVSHSYFGPGSTNSHDANYLTFGRVEGFREFVGRPTG